MRSLPLCAFADADDDHDDDDKYRPSVACISTVPQVTFGNVVLYICKKRDADDHHDDDYGDDF